MATGLFNLKQQLQGLIQKAWSGTQKTNYVEYLVVAGGGAGSCRVGSGGGAGGLLQGIVPVTNGTSYTITVGAGATGAGWPSQAPSGSNSVFGSIAAIGGGGGGAGGIGTGTANSGGSGGGGASSTISSNNGGQGTFGQGNAGGVGSLGNIVQGGGGGAGTVGLNAIVSATIGGNGGAGIASAISGTVTAYAGGGGGGANSGTAGVGGVGGGASGTNNDNVPTGATANTGGGGGGSGYGSSGFQNGGSGGSGIVIISYPDTYSAPASFGGANSPTASTSGSGSLSFNGSNQFISYNAQTPFVFGTGDFTIEGWVNSTSYANSQSFFDFRGTNTVSPAPVLLCGSNLTYYANGAAQINATPPSLNTWVHLAVVRISGVTKLYVNGTQAGSSYTDTNNYIVGTLGPNIGTNGLSAGYMTGYMSNIRFVKGVGVYTGTFTPSTAPLTATQSSGTNISAITGTQTSLLLNSVSGAYIADSSTNSYNPTSTTNPTWNQASPCATGLGYKNRVYTWTGSGTVTF
jgi:hypothetical protein